MAMIAGNAVGAAVLIASYFMKSEKATGALLSLYVGMSMSLFVMFILAISIDWGTEQLVMLAGFIAVLAELGMEIRRIPPEKRDPALFLVKRD